VTVNGANVTGVNFTAASLNQTYSVSGTISPASAGSGTSVALSGPVPVLVQSAHGSAATGSSSATVSFGVVSAAGDTIVVFTKLGGTTITSITDNQTGGSNTYTSVLGPTQWGVTPNPTDRWSQVFVAKNITGGTNLNLTATLASGSTHPAYLAALEYSGVDPVNPINTTSVATGKVSQNGAPTTGNLTTTIANTKLIATSWDSNESYSSTGNGTGYATDTAAGAGSLTGGPGWANLTEDETAATPGSWNATTGTAPEVDDWAIQLIALTPAPSQTVSADASGNYTFTNVNNGAYTVTPGKSGFTFSPASQFVTVNGTNVTGVNFTSSVPYTVAAASFTPAAGAYSSAQTVTVSTTTAGASIRYTTDGATPSETAGTLYSGPITVGNITTVTAIAYLSGENDSAVTSAVYTITGTVASPSFTPAAGTYPSAQTVAVSTTTAGASIRYTTDGSAPSETAGTLYSGPITVSNTTTIKAIAYISGWTDSIVASAAYSISSGCTGSAAMGKDYVRLGTRIVTIDQFASGVVLVAGIVSTPSGPAGPTSGVPGASYTYTTNGSMDSCGIPVQYRFNWGDGTDSGWLQAGTNQASHTWALGGTYNVTVQARSAANTFVHSGISSSLSVAIQSVVPTSVVQSASATNVYTEPAWWGGALSISQMFSSNNTAGDTIVVAAGVQQLNTQHATAPVTVTDTQGNTYTQVFWVPSGTDDGPALGLFIATNIKAGADIVTVTYSASQAPYTTTFTNYIAIAEYQGLSTPTIQASAAQQHWTGSTPSLAITDSFGTPVTLTFGNGELNYTYGVVDLVSNNVNHLIACGVSILTSPNTITTSPTGYATFGSPIQSVTNGQSLYLWSSVP
jgi:hypothetical protein